MINGVVFDLGGTLVWGDRGRLEDGDAWAATNFLRSLGYAGDPEALWESILRHRSKALHQIPRQYVTLEALREATVECGMRLAEAELKAAETAFFAPEVQAAVLIPGMRDLVRELSDHVRLAVFSNTTSHDFIATMMEHLEMSRFFDVIVTSAKCGWRKPEPAGFEFILKRWGFPPRSVAMVGDSMECDVTGARAVGMPAVWFRADVPRPHPPGNGVPTADTASEIRSRLREMGLPL